MAWYPQPTNITSMNDLFTYVNTNTSLLGVVNMGVMMLIMIWTIIFISQPIRDREAMISSTAVTTVLGILMFFMGWVNQYQISVLIIIASIIIFIKK